MKRARWIAVVLLMVAGFAHAQWTIEDSTTTADLRGIANVGGGVAWASGTNGTVLRTEDGGYLWQRCTVPPGAEHLDFRGVQAFDANTAIVMSSGKGDLSRLYKTTDGCHSWKLVFTNPDVDGFWDGLVVGNGHSEGLIIGDQVGGRFAIFSSLFSNLQNWQPFVHTVRSPTQEVPPPRSKNEVIFAASNTILIGGPGGGLAFVTGGGDGSYLYATKWHRQFLSRLWPDRWSATFITEQIPMAKGPSAGAFSFAVRAGCPDNNRCAIVVVGGDFMKPDERSGTGAYGEISDQSEVPRSFAGSDTPPNGYRSAVAYVAASKTWITVGPNGTDISTDDGRNWRALHPALHEAADADRNWNALSLPFVVGPHGHIGKLNPQALTQ